MAQAACEACVELVLTNALRARVSDAAIAEFITNSLDNYNPKTGRVQNLYELLFGNRIQRESFWSSFDKHVSRRNNIVHRGHLATPQQSDESIATVEKVIDHLLENRP